MDLQPDRTSTQRGAESTGAQLQTTSNIGHRSVSEQLQSQRDAWKMQQQKEVREDIEEGKGMSDMIIDQIWDVWNWGRKRNDED